MKEIYVFGGYDGDKELNRCEKYSISENKWTSFKPMSMSL